MAASKRAFSTDFNDHIGLVHTFARKGWGRMIAAHINVEYDDVFQEMSVAFVKASEAYDPEKGFAFTTYAGQAIFNEFNRYFRKRVTEQMELGLVSVEELGSHANDGEGGGDMYETFDSGDRSPEEALARKQEMINNLRGLSPTAKFLAAQLLSPAPELEEAFADFQRQTLAEGKRAVLSMNLHFIGRHYGIERARLAKAIKELKTTYGV